MDTKLDIVIVLDVAKAVVNPPVGHVGHKIMMVASPSYWAAWLGTHLGGFT
jgi:hypothetical protein